MQKYKCINCGYVYDTGKGFPVDGVVPGTTFEDVPDDWICPVCGAGKKDFSPLQVQRSMNYNIIIIFLN